MINSDKLSRRTLLCYSTGSIVETSIFAFCGLYLFNFYTDVVKLSPMLIGIALSIRFFLDAISDPVIGYLSDKIKNSHGRRIPWFVPGVIGGVISFYFLLTPPLGWSQISLFFYLAAFSAFLVLSLTIFGIPYLALSWELSSDYHERTRISTYRRIFEVFAEIVANLMIPVVLAVSLFGITQEASAYPIAAVFIGVLCLTSVFIVCVGVKESVTDETNSEASLLSQLKTVFRNKPFLILLSAFTLISIADRICIALLFYLLEYLHEIPKEDAIPYFLTFFAGSLLSPGLWMILAKHIEKKQCYLVAMAAWEFSFASFALHSWSPHILHCVVFLMGSASSGVLTLPGAIVPDVIEYDQIKTRQRREGLFAGVAKFAWKMGSSTCFLVIGYLLSHIGYEGEKPSVETLFGLQAIFIVGPACLIITAMIVFSYFPITKVRYIRIRNILERYNARRSEGETRELENS
ncbi:Inner membrane symporter YicJ [Polystyrenella longa]|uniref:Inner membrane symporter YicJ n=1 Tax=Polystyrenella longa TaxID=2528007 RepID=A0A518CTH9_9PLAN|nr:Inner membrane symporter YicJ [Polystyrenella longa]